MKCRQEKYDELASDERRMLVFWSKVDKSGDCWNWTAALSKGGYGFFWNCYAHRVAYTEQFGSVGGDVELDHLCRNRKCVRPDHLEPVSRRENLMRSESFV